VFDIALPLFFGSLSINFNKVFFKYLCFLKGLTIIVTEDGLDGGKVYVIFSYVYLMILSVFWDVYEALVLVQNL
jgi:hypothetical protein